MTVYSEVVEKALMEDEDLVPSLSALALRRRASRNEYSGFHFLVFASKAVGKKSLRRALLAFRNSYTFLVTGDTGVSVPASSLAVSSLAPSGGEVAMLRAGAPNTATSWSEADAFAFDAGTDLLKN